MTRVIVTGAAGFIGANVARRLLDDGLEPFLLTLPSSDRWRLADLNGDARLVPVDLADQDGRARVVVSDVKPDWVLPSRRARRLLVADGRRRDPARQRRRYGQPPRGVPP